MKILGVDPGTARIGYGLLEGRTNPQLLAYGTIEVVARGTQGLRELSEKFSELLDRHVPEIAGVEKIFFAKNQKTAIPVAEARGVILIELLRRNIPVIEWRPSEVKIAVTSYGFADKKAVAKMVKKMLCVADLGPYDDATDALAIALATAFHDPRLEG